MISLIGTRVLVSKNLCRQVHLRWARPHRRPRIAKKWSRFGQVLTPCEGYAYEMHPSISRDLIACPHWIEKMNAVIANRGGK